MNSLSLLRFGQQFSFIYILNIYLYLLFAVADAVAIAASNSTRHATESQSELRASLFLFFPEFFLFISIAFFPRFVVFEILVCTIYILFCLQFRFVIISFSFSPVFGFSLIYFRFDIFGQRARDHSTNKLDEAAAALYFNSKLRWFVVRLRLSERNSKLANDFWLGYVSPREAPLPLLSLFSWVSKLDSNNNNNNSEKNSWRSATKQIE